MPGNLPGLTAHHTDVPYRVGVAQVTCGLVPAALWLFSAPGSWAVKGQEATEHQTGELCRGQPRSQQRYPGCWPALRGLSSRADTQPWGEEQDDVRVTMLHGPWKPPRRCGHGPAGLLLAWAAGAPGSALSSQACPEEGCMLWGAPGVQEGVQSCLTGPAVGRKVGAAEVSTGSHGPSCRGGEPSPRGKRRAAGAGADSGGRWMAAWGAHQRPSEGSDTWKTRGLGLWDSGWPAPLDLGSLPRLCPAAAWRLGPSCCALASATLT